jgi:putative ABC transport system permease protein
VARAAVRRHGLTAVRAGWLIEADRPFTTAQLAAARDLALARGMVAESRDTGPPLKRVPIAELTVTIIGLPLVAATAAGLLAGREPSTIARTTME